MALKYPATTSGSPTMCVVESRFRDKRSLGSILLFCYKYLCHSHLLLMHKVIHYQLNQSKKTFPTAFLTFQIWVYSYTSRNVCSGQCPAHVQDWIDRQVHRDGSIRSGASCFCIYHFYTDENLWYVPWFEDACSTHLVYERKKIDFLLF